MSILRGVLATIMLGLAAGCSEAPPDVPDKLVWQTGLPQALTQAKAEKKQVLMDFTGSDWCPACIMLHKRVFASEDFAAFARTNLVLVRVDFPHKQRQSDELKKANQALAEKFGIEGFPTIILLNGDGKVLDKTVGYDNADAKAFVEALKKAEAKS